MKNQIITITGAIFMAAIAVARASVAFNTTPAAANSSTPLPRTPDEVLAITD